MLFKMWSRFLLVYAIYMVGSMSYLKSYAKWEPMTCISKAPAIIKPATLEKDAKCMNLNTSITSWEEYKETLAVFAITTVGTVFVMLEDGFKKDGSLYSLVVVFFPLAFIIMPPISFSMIRRGIQYKTHQLIILDDNPHMISVAKEYYGNRYIAMGIAYLTITCIIGSYYITGHFFNLYAMLIVVMTFWVVCIFFIVAALLLLRAALEGLAGGK